MSFRHFPGIVLLLAALWAPHTAFSQVPDDGPPGEAPTRYAEPDFYASLGLNLAAAVPAGEFADHVSFGFGVTGDASIRLTPSGWLGLRLDGGAIWYGNETWYETVQAARIPFEVKATTENYIAFGALGPQLHFAGLPFSARVYGLVGLSLFETRTFLRFDTRDVDVGEVFLDSRAHLKDWTPSLALGGELRYVFAGSRDGTVVGVGLNIDWRRHGTTRYLVEGSLSEVDGRTGFEPIETRADFLLISLGIWFGTW